METTSGPESRLSLGDTVFRLQFHRQQDGWMWRQTEIGQVLPVKVQSDRFPQVFYGLVERSPLRNHTYLKTFGNV